MTGRKICQTTALKFGWLVFAILVFILTLSAPNTNAFASTGSDLKDWCSKYSDPPNPDLSFSETWSVGRCEGFIKGVIWKVQTWESPPFCIPASATTGQLIEVVKRRLDDHSEELQVDAPKTVINTFTSAYPCPSSWWWFVLRFPLFGIAGVVGAKWIRRKKKGSVSV